MVRERRAMHLVTALAAAIALTVVATAAAAATHPYASVPSVGDSVRFDGSAGGETRAWAYPNASSLEAYLGSTIDASFGTTSYEDYKRKMGAVLTRSLVVGNGTQATVQKVAQFSYRDHEDVEVQLRVASGQLAHALVWTTPAELVTSAGHRYLR